MATIKERLKGVPRRLIVLAACAFARTVEHLLTDKRSLKAIETTERFADGLANLEEMKAATLAAWTAAALRIPKEPEEMALALELHHAMIWGPNTEGTATVAAARVVIATAATATAAARTEVRAAAKEVAEAVMAAAVLPIADRDRALAIEAATASQHSILDCLFAPRIQHLFPVHVKGLATTIYEKRDWSLMPILADTLEEMGLADFAQHCRQPIHAKGCHVLDSILGLQ